jgi:hypothetical protein
LSPRTAFELLHPRIGSLLVRLRETGWISVPAGKRFHGRSTGERSQVVNVAALVDFIIATGSLVGLGLMAVSQLFRAKRSRREPRSHPGHDRLTPLVREAAVLVD